MHSRKCEISRLLGCAQHPLKAAGWDEESSNIDPQAVYHTAWGDFGLRPRCPSTKHPLRAQVGMKNCRTSTRKPYTIRRGAISAIEKRDFVETQSVSYLRDLGLQKIKDSVWNFPYLPYPFVPVFRSSPKMPLNLCEDSIAEKKVYAGVHFQKTRKASCHVALRVF